MIKWSLSLGVWIACGINEKKVGAVWQSLENEEIFYVQIDPVREIMHEHTLTEAMKLLERIYKENNQPTHTI